MSVEIVSVAVSVESSGVATCEIVTPPAPDAPDVMTSADPVRCEPVIVSGTTVPTAPAPGEICESAGAGRRT